MRMILAILGALMLGITAVISAIPAQAQEVDCDDFDSQADAQAHLGPTRQPRLVLAQR